MLYILQYILKCHLKSSFAKYLAVHVHTVPCDGACRLSHWREDCWAQDKTGWARGHWAAFWFNLDGVSLWDHAVILLGVLEYSLWSCGKWRVRSCFSIEDAEWLISFFPPPHTHFQLIHQISGEYNTWNNKNKSLYIKFLVGELCR